MSKETQSVSPEANVVVTLPSNHPRPTYRRAGFVFNRGETRHFKVKDLNVPHTYEDMRGRTRVSQRGKTKLELIKGDGILMAMVGDNVRSLSSLDEVPPPEDPAKDEPPADNPKPAAPSGQDDIPPLPGAKPKGAKGGK